MGIPRPMARKTIDSPYLSAQIGQPDFSLENDVWTAGNTFVCGVDEAGRGPLAGPVVAAAVILDPNATPDGLNDSKKISEAKRTLMFDAIIESSHVSIGSVSAAMIDKINIRQASLLAMKRAIVGLEIQPDHALLDGNAIPDGLAVPATAVVKGDARSRSIAAASIIAKVTRDRMMDRASHHFPNYGFEGHKGYPTQAHRSLLMRFGPCPLHRKTFRPVIDALKRETTVGSGG